MRPRNVVSRAALGALLITGLAGCGGTDTPAPVEPTPSVEATEPTAEPVDVTVPGTVVTKEEADAAGVTTYVASAGERIVVDPAQELPQSVQDDLASLTDRQAANNALTQLHGVGVRGMFVMALDVGDIAPRFLVDFNTGELYTADNPPAWSDSLSAHSDGFETAAEALAYAAELRASHEELGALPLYDLTD